MDSHLTGQLRQRPTHIGIIPDGNRRWAEQRGLPRSAGYAAGIDPGVRLLPLARRLGIEEVSAYGFTKENVRRPSDQVAAFQAACVEFAHRMLEAGAGLLVVGDTKSPAFPAALRRFAQVRSQGTPRLNLLVNYGWRWDLTAGMRQREQSGSRRDPLRALGSHQVSRIDLVIRWGGRRRLSGFLPVQCAYADIVVVDTLWPDMREQDVLDAIAWYARQDVTLGG